MKMNTSVHEHYRLLLGLCNGWIVKDVDLDIKGKQVNLCLEWEAGRKCECAKCGKLSPVYDHGDEQSWQHLNTMQFKTIIKARVPRVKCEVDGVLTVQVPWADPLSGFTKMFECFVIDVLKASQSVDAAAELVGLSWDQTHGIMERAVKRGLKQREIGEVRNAGIDEKNFLKGQSYISLLNDLDGKRVLEVAIGRNEAAAEWLFDSLSEEELQSVEAVAMDMAKDYRKVTEQKVPHAVIVHDKYHIVAHLNNAVKEVQRVENKELLSQGDHTLKGTRTLVLMNSLEMSPDQQASFEELKTASLKTSRAWGIKELFIAFWEHKYEKTARNFFKDWYNWASHCQIKPIIRVAKMIKRHFENIITYIKHPITNALSEGMNSKIQTIKSNARGFRNFANYRIRILFYCGKLNLHPV